MYSHKQFWIYIAQLPHCIIDYTGNRTVGKASLFTYWMEDKRVRMLVSGLLYSLNYSPEGHRIWPECVVGTSSSIVTATSDCLALSV